MATVHRNKLTGVAFQTKNGTRANCPNCYTLNIRWRVKRASFICGRCGQVFDREGNMLPARPERKEK